MSEDGWHKVLRQISPRPPVDVTPRRLRGSERSGLPIAITPEAGCVSTRLWALPDTLITIGVRVRAPVPDPARVALRLAAMAAERMITPVILSSLHVSGFEQFGFRIERLPTDDPAVAEAFEEELRAFWNFAMVVDVADVAAFG